MITFFRKKKQKPEYVYLHEEDLTDEMRRLHTLSGVKYPLENFVRPMNHAARWSTCTPENALSFMLDVFSVLDGCNIAPDDKISLACTMCIDLCNRGYGSVLDVIARNMVSFVSIGYLPVKMEKVIDEIEYRKRNR